MTSSEHTVEELRERFEEIKKQQEEYKRSNPPKVTDAEIVACFEEDQNRLRTGNSIADELDVHSSTIYRRLRDLEDEGIVESWNLGPVIGWCLKGSLWVPPYSDSILKKLRGSMGEEYE